MRFGPTLTPHIEPQDDGRPYAIFVVNVVPPNGDHPGAEFYYWLNPDDPARAMNYDAQFVDRLDSNVMHVYIAAECVRLTADGPGKWQPVEIVIPWHLYTPGQLLKEVSGASTNRS